MSVNGFNNIGLAPLPGAGLPNGAVLPGSSPKPASQGTAPQLDIFGGANSTFLQPGGAPGLGNVFRMPTVPAGTNIADGSALKAFVSNSIDQGVIPSLNDMNALTPAPDGNANPQQSQQLNGDVVQLLQQAGPAAVPRIQQISALMGLRRMQGTTSALSTMAENLDPESAEGQQLQARQSALMQLQSGLQGQFEQAINGDPTHGAAIQFGNPMPTKSGNGGGVLNLFNDMADSMLTALFG